ncbi:helix-turn-helix domain-containing protein [Aneurinibacillus uraniidurans]|uniref:helix-turn-helix domain-containing protein n=1 Tax=Aneurinibacillus uraniidurans TaxID=2966586 RepID=UPI002349342E|nr:helix-turn-helix transcriptional regulator [Aneurinibacillus sp. B1]WCN38662.1 helix-turn-helix transcriptional regulator [Aneurinibacillus sp. B1]
MKHEFGKQVRLLREQQGISLNAMAKMLGVSTGYLSNLESGKTETVNLTVLQRLFSMLEIKACPLCQQEKSSSKSSEGSSLNWRVHRLYQTMIDLASSDPMVLEHQLQLLESGFLFSKTALRHSVSTPISDHSIIN